MTDSPSLETKIAHLRRPESFPERPPQVDAIETHMSWLFLTDRFVYKMKKPIRYDRLDFATLDLRRFYCEEEVRLNRRLAETVYKGTLALTLEHDGKLALAGRGTPVEWLVHMRRLPESRMLDWILARRVVEEKEVRAAALRLADFYANAPSIEISSDAFCKRLEEGILTDQSELSRPEFGLSRARVDAIASSQLAFLKDQREIIDQRVQKGRILEGHGDLRPEHICLTPEPQIIDCLEFSAELREVDPADELAFLSLECERLGQAQVGPCFLDAYQERTQDRLPAPLLGFYRNHRILRRARIAAWHLSEPGARDESHYATRARRYLELAHP